MITTNTNHAPNTPTQPTVHSLLKDTLAQLDLELDRLDQVIQESRDINPLLATRAIVALDNFAGEARRLADLMTRPPRPAFHHNGNAKPFHHPAR